MLYDAYLHDRPFHVLDLQGIQHGIEARVNQVHFEVDDGSACLCLYHIMISNVRNLRLNLHRVSSHECEVLGRANEEVRHWLLVVKEVFQSSDSISDFVATIWGLNEGIGPANCAKEISNRIIEIGDWI